ncbi:MAG: glycosyltransferase family 2 protein [Solirubrobacterales bacterium]
MSAQADPWSRVAVVTVTHHSAAIIEPCLRSVAKAAQVIVVDNASDDDTPAAVRRILPTVDLVENKIGRGFGNGCNQGLERVTAEFALLLGPDSTIDDDSLSRLVGAADTWPEGAMFGPAIIAPDGHVELSHDIGLFERMNGGKRVDLHMLPEGPLCAEHLSGAVLLVRMDMLRRVGFFDRNIFLYYEDDDLCIRMRRAGHSLILVPEARATHVGGGSSRPSVHHRWEKFWHMAWSRLYIEAKYKGRGAALASAASRAPLFLAKALGYALKFDKWKLVRDAARLGGTLAWVAGVKAMPVVEDRK